MCENFSNCNGEPPSTHNLPYSLSTHISKDSVLTSKYLDFIKSFSRLAGFLVSNLSPNKKRFAKNDEMKLL